MREWKRVSKRKQEKERVREQLTAFRRYVYTCSERTFQARGHRNMIDKSVLIVLKSR